MSKSRWVATDFIANSTKPSGYSAGEIVEFIGWSASGDGGDAQWKATGNVIAASQTPAMLGTAKCSDASGNEFELAFGNTLIIEKLGGVSALQAALNSGAPEVAWFSSELNLDPVKYLIPSNTYLHGPGAEYSILNVNSSHPAGLELFENADQDPNGERVATGVKISGFTINGSNFTAYSPWLTSSSGAVISDPEFDYSPSGIIGQGGDIFDVVAADRRNPAYQNVYTVINLVRCYKPEVFNVRFLNNVGFGVADAGCYGCYIHHCDFVNHGIIDNISSAIWTQSSGNPDTPTASYADSELHLTELCNFDCNRSAITLSPTKGGVFRFNTVSRSGESSVFSSSRCNMNGGESRVYENIFKESFTTDITSHHIEADCNNYHIYKNELYLSDWNSVSVNGCSNSYIDDNDFFECVTLTNATIPYGPFSERYAFAVGSPPVAGSPANTEISVINWGIQNDEPSETLRIRRNNINDNRSSSLANYILRGSRTGTVVSTCKNIEISNNDFTNISDASIPKISIQGSVMDPEMTLRIRDNQGHESDSPVNVVIQKASGETGVDSVTVGFRPSHVEIYAALNNDTVANGQVSRASYSPSGGASNAMVISATNGTGQRIGLTNNKIIRIVDSSGAVVMLADLAAWNETGLSISTTQITATVNLHVTCYP